MDESLKLPQEFVDQIQSNINIIHEFVKQKSPRGKYSESDFYTASGAILAFAEKALEYVEVVK